MPDDQDNDGHFTSSTTNNAEDGEMSMSDMDNMMRSMYPRGFQLSNFTLEKGWYLNASNAICTFRGRPCNWTTDFNHVFTAFGNCFTFNANNDAFQDQPGAKNGLSLEINIEQQYYSNRLQLGDQVDAGIFFHVHNQSVPPSVETDGRAVPPGFHAYVGLTRTDSYSIDPPYGLCNKSAELVNFPDYSVAACVLECKEQHMLRECGCELFEYEGRGRECSLMEVTTCAKPLLGEIKTIYYFLWNHLYEFSNMCDCPVACEDVTYATSVTYTSIPSNSTASELATNLRMSPTEVKANYVIMDIYLENLNYIKSEQLPAVEPSALISDIGGQFGLFMGFSLLTIIEFIEFAAMTLYTWILSAKRQPKVDIVMVKMTSTRNEKEEKAKEEPQVSIEAFATSTSAHGFARAYQSRHLVAKAIWTALITAGFVVAVVQIYFRFASYFRYDTTTKITMVFAKELQFPAVTICNAN
ncbi:acid-sensing ion channel 5-like, partial [Lingula anatina]|uniref:Acid-sensing ion channel 5-like n=1 Tax=Lingula anatina TaxID=7574 RepID=A0A2R2MKK2_LINAN